MSEELIYGPNTAAVQRVIERCKTLTDDEVERLVAAWYAHRGESWYAASNAAETAARSEDWYAASDAAWDAAGKVAQSQGWFALGDALIAYIVQDLITAEQFDLLAGPWLSVIGEEEK